MVKSTLGRNKSKGNTHALIEGTSHGTRLPGLSGHVQVPRDPRRRERPGNVLGAIRCGQPLGWSARICRVHMVGLRYALFVEFEKVERVLEVVDLVLDDCVVDVEWRVVPHEPRERHRIGCGCDVLRSDTSERSSTVCFQRKRTLLLGTCP